MTSAFSAPTDRPLGLQRRQGRKPAASACGRAVVEGDVGRVGGARGAGGAAIDAGGGDRVPEQAVGRLVARCHLRPARVGVRGVVRRLACHRRGHRCRSSAWHHGTGYARWGGRLRSVSCCRTQGLAVGARDDAPQRTGIPDAAPRRRSGPALPCRMPSRGGRTGLAATGGCIQGRLGVPRGPAGEPAATLRARLRAAPARCRKGGCHRGSAAWAGPAPVTTS